MRTKRPATTRLMTATIASLMGVGTLCADAVAADVPRPLTLSAYMIGLSVADMVKMTNWYVEKLGFKVTRDIPMGEGGRLRFIEAGNQRIELLSQPGSKPGPERGLPPAHGAINGFTHLTMEVPDIDAAKDALAARGVTPALGPVPVPPLGVKVLFLRDPEGNLVELLQTLSH